MRQLRTISSLVLVAGALAAALATSAGAAANPVLGAKAFAAPYGTGWGTAEPSEIFNGGDPSGSVRDIKWSGWGNPTAIGWGRKPLFKPPGGYYRKLGRVKLRATELGKCGKRRAYLKLEFRAQKKPGGKLGKWISWSSTKTLCKPPY